MVWLNVMAMSIQSTTVDSIAAMSEVEVLHGPRVILRAPRLDDAEALFERIASDPEVPRYMSWRPHPDVDETRRVIREIFNVGGETTWLVELRDGGGPIGLCGWRRPQLHIIDFGYCLGRPWWRQGLMSEAVQLLLDKAQRDPTVYRVTAHCHVDNVASARLLEGSGLTPEGAAGALRRAAEHQPRAAGLSAVRQGAQVTMPRTAQARAHSVKPSSANCSRSLDSKACRADSGNDET
jgi:RimJ/RimL family protein N-acetyltransferase